ncbi:PucR family transcriptional regulator [Neobacillus muris]|uniref:PucR family transcriptional regulator n=1 Tax=Neobacillus muris TaxID=2941334 RepID=UPI00204130A2|nr:PucR family transcriptional regulator [Neobacillus muris]
MKVHELLTIPELEGMNLIAGSAGKEREVEAVNMMDAPDIIHFLHQNEFLVTTAYHLKDDPLLLAELINAMAAQGCAGLGIKTRRYLHEVPKEVIQLADKLDFPIIELPLELSLGEVVNHSLKAILDKQAGELALVLETHREFTKTILRGKGIELLLQDLSSLIHQPVQLLDQHFKPIYQTGGNSNKLVQLEGLPLPSAQASSIAFSVRAAKQTCTIFPVPIGEKKIGYLLILGDLEQSDRLAYLTIEQAVNVISFTLMKEHALRQKDRSIRNDFFLHFLDGTFTTQEEIIGRASEFSLKNDQKYICAAGKVDGDDHLPTFTKYHEKVDDIYDFIEGEVSQLSPSVHFFTKGRTCILLFEITEEISDPGNYTVSLLGQLQKRVMRYYHNTVSFGLSNLSHSFLQIKNAEKEAMDALSQGKRSKKTEYIQTYQTKDVIEILRLIPRDDLKNFYTFALSGFIGTKLEEEQSLLETLSVYLETHCQISETAKRLFVHRNTVVYRIEKCEEILGKSLKDPETTLQIRMALRIQPLLNG